MNSARRVLRRLRSILLLPGLAFPLQAAAASPPDNIFAGKQITVFVGYGPGGSYDSCARLLAAHLGRFIPGHPTLVPQNVPGAGSIKLANQLYNVLPRDGTAIGTIGDVLLVKQILGKPGIQFVGSRFNWLGRLAMPDGVFVVRPETGVMSIADVRKQSITVGVPGAGSATALDVAVLNRLLGTKFRAISGYNSGTEVKLALERGEVEASGSLSWRIDREWIHSHGYRVLYQKSSEDAPDLPDAPRFAGLGKSPDEEKLLRFFNSPTDIARSFIVPPGVPQERVRLLRTAFVEMTKDPAFRAEAAKLKLHLSVLPGAELQRVVSEDSNISARLVERAKEVSRSPS